MFVVELRIHPHHLLLALLAIPVLWVAKHECQRWRVSNFLRRHERLTREGQEAQRLERRAKGPQTTSGPSSTRLRALAANFKP